MSPARHAYLVLLCFLALAPAARGNPLHISAAGMAVGAFGLELMALHAYLRRRAVDDTLRVLVAWVPVTAVTWVVLIYFAGQLDEVLQLSDVGGVWLFAVLELLVVVTEALALQFLLRCRPEPLTFGEALLGTFLANLVSLLGGAAGSMF